MQLQQATWNEVLSYLASSKAIILPIGSTEQHGPTGLIGTDILCVERIAEAAGEKGGFLVAPSFNVGMAQHHLHFSGTMSLRPSTMIAVIRDWTDSLMHHGFRRFYWLNGHGGNIASITAAFSEIYHDRAFAAGRPAIHCMLRNWWDLPGVAETCRALFGENEGSHATPSEISLTRYLLPKTVKRAEMMPKIAPTGPILDAEDFRRRFPDGRIGSDPTRASAAAGGQIFTAAVQALVYEFGQFAAG